MILTVAMKFDRGRVRVMALRIKEDLGVRLFYPTYREGLQSIYDETSNEL